MFTTLSNHFILSTTDWWRSGFWSVNKTYRLCALVIHRKIRNGRDKQCLFLVFSVTSRPLWRCILVYIFVLLTSWSVIILETLRVAEFVKKFPVFYWTRYYTRVFTRCRHLTLSRASLIQSTLFHSIFLRPISTYQVSCSLQANKKIVCISHLSHSCYIIHLSNSLGFNHLNVRCRVQCKGPRGVVFSSLLSFAPFKVPNIFFSTLLSEILNLCSALTRETKFPVCKRPWVRYKIIVLYFNL